MNPKLICWELSVLGQKSLPLTGPLPEDYLWDLERLCLQNEGVYLAGIQVGDARRFAVSSTPGLPRVLYNPEVLNGKREVSELEGCLSFPEFRVKIRRFLDLELRYRDENWDERRVILISMIEKEDGREEQHRFPDSLLAKAVQHEVAHMDGLTLLNRLSNSKQRFRHQELVMKSCIQYRKQYGVSRQVVGPECLPSPSLIIIDDETIEKEPVSKPTIIIPE